LTAEIRDRGHDWNRKKVTRLMTVAEIEGVHRRRYGKKRSRIRAGSVAPDLDKRQFAAERPHQLWVAERTAPLPPAVCGCGRKIRVCKTVLAAGPILCGPCGTEFTTTTTTDPDSKGSTEDEDGDGDEEVSDGDEPDGFAEAEDVA
jgi:hypothetical protein